MTTNDITKEILIDLYINKELSAPEIGKVFGCTASNILYHLKKHNIKTRDFTQCKLGSKNSFYGKKHNKNSINNMSEKHKENHKNGIGNIFKSGKDNPMFNVRRFGKLNPMYKNGKIGHKGYILVLNRDHPFATKKGYVYEHRLVMEKKLGRYLTKEEVVHHINEIRDDNRIENLHLFKNESEHQKYHKGNKSWLHQKIS